MSERRDVTTRPLMILGAGYIARALLQQLLAREEYLRERYNLTLPVAAVASSRYLAAGAPYLGAEEVAQIAGAGLESGEAAPPDRRAQQMDYLTDLARSSPHRAIVVDLTASDGMAPMLLAALDAGVDVAVANKKPLCENYDTFARLTAHPRGRLAYEATVGAGLPIIHTLRALLDAGDELVDMTACLSGTLGYLCTEVEDGRPLSQVVPEARTMNQHLELDDVPGAPMIPLEEGDVEKWLAGLARHDVALAARVRSAREQGDVLRYVARILPGKCEVGLREVPRLSAVGRLRGTDNILTVHTRFYDERPLVISGPGAGPDVTAAGVFGDLLRLACIA